MSVRDQHRAEQREEQRFEFFLAASHQLKTPVAIIQWCLQSALERGELSVKDGELIRKAALQADSMGALITDMLHVLRLEDHQRQSGFERVMIAPLIQGIYTQYAVPASERGISLVVEPITTKLAVLADPTFLKQAIINLVDNAIKYTKPNGSVSITATATAEMVKIMVVDEGIGIGEAEQAQLFREFFRGQEAKTVAHEGTGLGLVLVKHITESFHGHVEVASQLGKGSEFSLVLPSA